MATDRRQPRKIGSPAGHKKEEEFLHGARPTVCVTVHGYDINPSNREGIADA